MVRLGSRLSQTVFCFLSRMNAASHAFFFGGMWGLQLDFVINSRTKQDKDSSTCRYFHIHLLCYVCACLFSYVNGCLRIYVCVGLYIQVFIDCVLG